MSLNRLIAHAFQNVLVFGLMTQVFVQNLIISFYSLIWEQLLCKVHTGKCHSCSYVINGVEIVQNLNISEFYIRSGFYLFWNLKLLLICFIIIRLYIPDFQYGLKLLNTSL